MGRPRRPLASLQGCWRLASTERCTVCTHQSPWESEASDACSKMVLSQLFSLKPSDSADRDAKLPGPSCHFTQSRFIKKTNKQTNIFLGLPWWLSGGEFTCQRRRHGYDPWSRRIPHATEQRSPSATTIEPVLCAVLSHSVVTNSLWHYGLYPTRLLCPWGFSRQAEIAAPEPTHHNYWSLCELEPVLCNKRSHHNEKPT